MRFAVVCILSYGLVGAVLSGWAAWSDGRSDWFSDVFPLGFLWAVVGAAAALGLIAGVLSVVDRVWPEPPPWNERACTIAGCLGGCRSRMVRRGKRPVMEVEVTCKHGWSVTASPGTWGEVPAAEKAGAP